jgi:hypothetical protein
LLARLRSMSRGVVCIPLNPPLDPSPPKRQPLLARLFWRKIANAEVIRYRMRNDLSHCSLDRIRKLIGDRSTSTPRLVYLIKVGSGDRDGDAPRGNASRR